MKDCFVSTVKNVQAFTGGLDAVNDRGASESCLMLLDGPPGTGKTETVTWFASQTGALLLRAKQGWTPTRFYTDLLTLMGVKASARNLFSQVIDALSLYQLTMMKADKQATLIIDEADYVLEYPKGALLEAIRDITDTIELPTILVGMDRLDHEVAKWPQVARRISQRVHFKRLDLADVQEMVTTLCEFEVKPDLVAYLATAAEGYACEVVEGIASIERFARRNPGPVGCAEMAGAVLFFARHTSLPVKVREGLDA